jgi:hypothetical protein
MSTFVCERCGNVRKRTRRYQRICDICNLRRLGNRRRLKL